MLGEGKSYLEAYRVFAEMATAARVMTLLSVSLFAVDWTLTQAFCFSPALSTCSASVKRRSTVRCRATACPRAPQGLVTMRKQRQQAGPGLTNVQRVLDTRDRIKSSDDPCKVMISNLDYNLTEQEVKDFCRKAGPVAQVKLVKRWYARTSKGYGFVEFDQPLTAQIAIDDLNGTEFRGRVVELKPAITPQEKRKKEAAKEWERTQAITRQERQAQGLPKQEDEPKREKRVASRPSFTLEDVMSVTGRRVKPRVPVYADLDPEPEAEGGSA